MPPFRLRCSQFPLAVVKYGRGFFALTDQGLATLVGHTEQLMPATEFTGGKRLYLHGFQKSLFLPVGLMFMPFNRNFGI